MLDLYLKGGMLMHPILFASIVALAISLERGWFFRRLRGNVQAVFEVMAERISTGDRREAIRMAENIAGPVGVVLKEGLVHWEDGPEIAQEAMAIRGESLLQNVRIGIPILAIISSISMMLGLLGTVVGLVEAFQKVAEMEARVSPSLLASGIWTAMLTTVGGLFVAIPALISHHYFQGKVARLTFQIEHYGSELLLVMKKEEAQIRRPFQKRRFALS
jgi:biopolymer transport protein ExbB